MRFSKKTYITNITYMIDHVILLLYIIFYINLIYI
jgi:hypothetical protein